MILSVTKSHHTTREKTMKTKTMEDYNKKIKSFSGWALDYDDEADNVAKDGAYDVAKSLVEEDPWVATVLKKTGVTDVLGRIADDVYNVALVESEDDEEETI
jgi:hypothetical protein